MGKKRGGKRKREEGRVGVLSCLQFSATAEVENLPLYGQERYNVLINLYFYVVKMFV